MGRMGWNGGVEREVLERILALLLALAGLADRAACLPVYVRLPVLAILGYGEAAARSFVNAAAFGAPARAAAGASPAAGRAERLAASFRALALVLGAMLAQARRRARMLTGGAGPRMCEPDGRMGRRRRLARPLRHAARGPPGFAAEEQGSPSGAV